jgi:hypothetical protein
VQGLGPRFALEVAFLIALAIGAGIAELSATWIVVIMALAWLVICLFELALWAEGPRFPALERGAAPPPEEPEAAAVTEIRQPDAPRRKRFWRRGRDGEAA